MKSIKNIIKETVLKETNASITIDDSNFFSVLVEKEDKIFFKTKFFNFLVLITAIIMSIVIVVTSLIFFINDVLLYPNSPTINKQGAIIPQRSCNRQSVLFLFNSAENWVSTGIQLQKGDKIKISYSGGFHSDIAGLRKEVGKNDTLRYKWTKFLTGKSEQNPKIREKLLYNKEDAFFGSVLYTTASELGVQANDKEFFHQIEKDKTIKIRQNGTLFLSVNDIYLDSFIIQDYQNDNDSIFHTKEFITLQEFEKNGGRYKTDLFWIKNTDTVYVSGYEFREHFLKNPNVFFNDNIGEILVLIDINRKVDIWSWRTSWYRWTENTINGFYDNSSNHFWAFCKSVIFFFGAIFALVFVKLSFITYPLILLFCLPYIKRCFQKFKNKIQ